MVKLNKDNFAVDFDDYTHIIVPKNCIGIADTAYESLGIFADDRQSITVEEGNPIYKSQGNCLINVKQGTVVLGCKNSVIPNDGSIKIIGAYAFNGICGMESETPKGFTHINIPNSVEIIEHHAFADTGLTNIELPNELKKIGSMAFMLTNIGKEATGLFLPETIQHMGIGVFAGCKSLRRLRLFAERYVTEGDCIVDKQTQTVIAVHNGISGEIIPHSAQKIQALTFFAQNKGAKYYIDENITEIELSPLDLPTAIEFPITIVAKKGSYAHKFAIQQGIDYEEWI